MKFLEYPELAHLSRALTYDSAECTVHTRLEAYSCKSIHREKKMSKALEQKYSAESDSPPGSAFGPLDQAASRKVLYLLIATLNVAFPDHDFAEVSPGAFRREESSAGVVNALSTTLLSLRPAPGGVTDFAPRSYSSYPPSSDTFVSSPSSSPNKKAGNNALLSGTHPTFYRILDNIITLADCDVYSYTPPREWDPHAVDSDDEDDAMSEDMSGSSSDLGTFDFEPDFDGPPAPPTPSKSHELPYAGRRLGGLLWSSNWFFHNKKQKRILFVSVWARKRMGGWVPVEHEWERALANSVRAGFSP